MMMFLKIILLFGVSTVIALTSIITFAKNLTRRILSLVIISMSLSTFLNLYCSLVLPVLERLTSLLLTFKTPSLSKNSTISRDSDQGTMESFSTTCRSSTSILKPLFTFLILILLLLFIVGIPMLAYLLR